MQVKQTKSSKQIFTALDSSSLKKDLKIGYDGKRAANNLTGLGNYSRSLITQLAKQFYSNKYYNQ